MRRLPALFVLLSLLLVGCGGGTSSSTTSGTAGSSAAPAPSGAAAPSAVSSAPAASAPAAASACPTANTASFAKTRFVADLGGAAFLIRRYIYQPYTAGKLTKGASGRTVALIKAAAAAAASAKLLKNASANAKASPILCKTVAGPLSSLSGTVSGLTGSLRSGSLNPGLLGGLGGTLTSLLSKSTSAGVPVQEKQTGL